MCCDYVYYQNERMWIFNSFVPFKGIDFENKISMLIKDFKVCQWYIFKGYHFTDNCTIVFQNVYFH